MGVGDFRISSRKAKPKKKAKRICRDFLWGEANTETLSGAHRSPGNGVKKKKGRGTAPQGQGPRTENWESVFFLGALIVGGMSA